MIKFLHKKVIACITALTLTASLLPSNPFGIVYEQAVEAAELQQLTDADVESLYQKVSYERQSVHDPSIIKHGSDYYVFGSHMGVAKTSNLKDWQTPAINGEVETNGYYGTRDTKGNVTPVSYNQAFKTGAYGTKKIQVKKNGAVVEVSVDFSSFPASDWNTAHGEAVKGNMWAPDIIFNKSMGKYCLYTSLNGSKCNSLVVLLTSDNIEGPYVYEAPIVYTGFTKSGSTSYDKTDLHLVLNGGEKLSSLPARYDNKGTYQNAIWPHAIDPFVLYDDGGNLWLGYGSWSGGIYMLELDEETGLRDYTVTYNYEINGTAATDSSKADGNVTSDPYFGKKIAGGHYVSGEGAYVEKIGDYYFLFMSYGFYSPWGGYNMRIFRSKNPDGPYVDVRGTDAIYNAWVDNYRSDSRGLQLMGNYQWNTMDVAEIAQGHNSALQDDDGNSYVIYHTKLANDTAEHQLRVHQLYLNEDGWIVAAPYEYAGEKDTTATTAISSAVIAGEYDFIMHQYSNTNAKDEGTVAANVIIAKPKNITLGSDGKITGAYTGTWTESANAAYATIVIDGTTYKGVFTEQTIDGTNMKTVCFTAVDNKGKCIWGSKKLSDNVIVAYDAKNAKSTIPFGTSNNLTLETQGELGSTITWSSSNTSVLSNDGTVSSKEIDVQVTLTKTVTKGNYFYQKDYPVIVYGTADENADKLALYDSVQSGDALMAVPSINENTGVSFTFDISNLNSDWTPVLVTDHSEHVYLSILNYGGENIFPQNAAILSEEAKKQNSGLEPWDLFLRQDCTVTISYNIDGSISFYRNGVLMLTYAADTAIGTYKVSDLSKTMANAVRSGGINVKYPISDLSIGYALGYDPSLEGCIEETLTGTKWWDETQVGKDYTLTGDGSIVLNVRADALNAGNYGAFSVELKGEPNYFLTTGSDKNAWGAEGSAGIGTLEGVSEVIESTLQKGHIYKITVTRSGQNFSVQYYDVTDSKEYWTVKWLNGNMPDTFGVHIIAQVGTYSVWQEETETLIGTKWWEGSQKGKDYTLTGDGSIVLNVKADALDAGDYGAFNVELMGEPNYYLTTGSDKNAWVAEGSAGIGTLEGIPEKAAQDSALLKDHIYKITITRIGSDFTIEYYDVTAGKEYWTVKWLGGNMPDTFGVHIIAQVGTYTVRCMHIYEAKQMESSCVSAQVFTCKKCGDTYGENVVVHHTKVIDEAVEPTCTTDGRTEGSHCSVCNKILTRQKVVEAAGHNYTVKSFHSGVAAIACSNCNSEFTITLNADKGVISDSYKIAAGAAEITLPTSDEIIRNGCSFKGWKDSSGTAITKITLSDFSKEDAENLTFTALWAASNELIGSISLAGVEGGFWDELLNKITFGLYNTNKKEVVIEAAGSGNVAISYLIVTEKPFERTEEDLAALPDSAWTAYDSSKPEILNVNSRCVIYVKLADEADQVKYISSDGIIEDETAPQITFETITSSVTDSSASFSVESNEDGTYYFALYEDSSDTLKDTDFTLEVINNAKKTGKVTANNAITIPVTELKKATDYNAYLVVKDKAGNISTRQQFTGTLQSMIAVTNATITGKFVYGELLEAAASNEQNIEDYSFQWYRSDKPITKDTDISMLTLISRANKGIYVPGKQDLGKYMAVVIAVLDEQYGGSALAYSTAPVQCKEITATVTIEDKVYDGSKDAKISEINLAGVLARDTVTAKAENAIFEDANAGGNKTVNVTGITLSGGDASYYQLASTRVTAAAAIKKAAIAPNAPNNSSTWSVSNSIETVSGVTGLPDGWSWSNDDFNISLPVGVEVTATAVYTGEDAKNYETVSVAVKLKRSNCNHDKTEVKDKVEPTCISAGYTGDTYCLDCGDKVQTGSEVKPLGHDYNEGIVTKEATCTEAGEITYTCSRCGDSYLEEIEPFGHTEEVDPAVAPTCTRIGLTEGSHCSVCGIVLVEQNPIQKIPHDYGEGIVTKEPTIDEEGIRTFTCNVCKNSYTETIPKLPTPDHKHEYAITTIEPTCTENGKKVSSCSCGDKIEEVIPALGHTEEVDPAIVPTCTEIGKTEGSHCSVCGEIIVAQSIVSALGHDYDEGVVTKQPTIEEEGIRTFTCNRCKHSYTERIPKLEAPGHEHKYVSSIVTAATCTQAGIRVFKCECNDSYEEVIPALGHKEVEDPAVEATCTADGKTEGSHCSVCGEILIEQSIVPAFAHDYISEVTKQPTYSETGIRTFTCSRCKDSYTESIPRLTSAQIPPSDIFNPSNGNTSGTTTPPETSKDPEAETPDTSVETKPEENNGSVVETKPDGTKVETITESQPDGSTVETVTETKPDGTVISTIKDVKTDGSIIETKEIVSADNSATLETIIETNVSGNSTINSVIKTGVSDSSDTVSISESLLNEVAADDRIRSVVIAITDVTVKSATAAERKQTVVTVEIPVIEGVSVEKVVLTKDSIDTAKETGKSLRVNVVNTTKDSVVDTYSVVIPAKQLAKIDSSVEEINVTINAERVTNVVKNSVKNAVTKVLNKNKGKEDKTCVVSVASNEASNAGMKLTIPVTEKTTIAKGSNVYVYKYDAKTGKLVETANCRKTVSKDGSVVVAATSGMDYVISAKKLSGKNVETIKDGISVSMSKKTAKAGKTVNVKVSLPDTVSTKSAFGTEKATITYKSSDSKIASVSKSGVVTTKKSGTVSIKTTVKLASGQKVIKEQKITVK